MSSKVITGAVIALAAGVAALIYNRKRDSINKAAADAYNATRDAVAGAESNIENAFS